MPTKATAEGGGGNGVQQPKTTHDEVNMEEDFQALLEDLAYWPPSPAATPSAAVTASSSVWKVGAPTIIKEDDVHAGHPRGKMLTAILPAAATAAGGTVTAEKSQHEKEEEQHDNGELAAAFKIDARPLVRLR